MDDDDRVRVRVPAILVGVASSFVPDRLIAELAGEVGPYWPSVRAVAREFADLPDCTLFELVSDHEHIVIRNADRRLLIDVDSGGDRVRVDVPWYAVKSVMSRLDRAARV